MAKNPKKAAAAPAIDLSAIVAGIDLAAIVAATNAGSFVHVNEAAAARLVADGMIELNGNIKNEAGEVAARATAKGIASVAAPVTGGEAARPTFAIEVSPALAPTKRNAGGRTDTYPFADLAAPTLDAAGNVTATAKFFVPATADKPEPWASLSSTVSAASKRYATKTGTETYTGKDKEGNAVEKTRDTFDYSRKFRIAEGEREGVKGAWIERVK